MMTVRDACQQIRTLLKLSIIGAEMFLVCALVSSYRFIDLHHVSLILFVDLFDVHWFSLFCVMFICLVMVCCFHCCVLSGYLIDCQGDWLNGWVTDCLNDLGDRMIERHAIVKICWKRKYTFPLVGTEMFGTNTIRRHAAFLFGSMVSLGRGVKMLEQSTALSLNVFPVAHRHTN